MSIDLAKANLLTETGTVTVNIAKANLLTEVAYNIVTFAKANLLFEYDPNTPGPSSGRRRIIICS